MCELVLICRRTRGETSIILCSPCRPQGQLIRMMSLLSGILSEKHMLSGPPRHRELHQSPVLVSISRGRIMHQYWGRNAMHETAPLTNYSLPCSQRWRTFRCPSLDLESKFEIFGMNRSNDIYISLHSSAPVRTGPANFGGFRDKLLGHNCTGQICMLNLWFLALCWDLKITLQSLNMGSTTHQTVFKLKSLTKSAMRESHLISATLVAPWSGVCAQMQCTLICHYNMLLQQITCSSCPTKFLDHITTPNACYSQVFTLASCVSYAGRWNSPPSACQDW